MNYHNITKNDMLNGEGLRVVLWVSGCSHHCDECQNPQTWDPNSGIPFDEDAKKELFTELDKDYISGITFSGGDPLYSSNRSCIMELIKEIKIKYPEKTIWLYTGYTYDEIKTIIDSETLSLIDVIVDGEYDKTKRDINARWVGSTNQNIIRTNKI